VPCSDIVKLGCSGTGSVLSTVDGNTEGPLEKETCAFYGCDD